MQAFAPQSGNSRSTEEAPAFADLIRNAVDSFFSVGRTAGGAGNQEQPASGTETKQSTPQPTPRPNPQSTASPPLGNQPMEGVENGNGKSVSSEQRRPEGWIVIDDDSTERNSSNVSNNPTTPQGNPSNTQNEGGWVLSTNQKIKCRLTSELFSDPRIATALAQLQEMGFSNQTDALRNLLIHYNGNVELVLRAILENQ